MVSMRGPSPAQPISLSVLALSSRFDGLDYLHIREHELHFQYSLCRVVLMVNARLLAPRPNTSFQYSLCRVVLMVADDDLSDLEEQVLSVLALSSRFDGPRCDDDSENASATFSTRSVESF